MQVTARLKNARISAQKVRLVADQVRGLPVEEAEQLLAFSNKKAAHIVKKVLLSAIANAEHNEGAAGASAALESEVGDLLFSVVNLARRLGIDPEVALEGTNVKFEDRFGAMEEALKDDGRSLEDAGLEEMEREWEKAKVDDARC